MNKWIINWYFDLLFLFIPGILALFLSQLVSYDLAYSIIFFIVFNFIDSGHTYTTLLLTVGNKDYKNRYLVPLFVFFGITLWYFVFDLKYFLEFIAFFTLYHNLRQNYGIFRWYSSKNNNNSKLMDNVFNLLLVIPVILFYCRNLKNDFILTYSKYAGSLFIKNNVAIGESFFGVDFHNEIGKYFFILFVVMIGISLIVFLIDLLKGKSNWSQIVSFYFFVYIYFTSFVLSNNLNELLSGLVISHGIIYVAMVVKRLKQNPKHIDLESSIILITILLLIIGGLLHFFEEIVIFDVKNFRQKHEYLYYILLLLYSLPLLTHYIWDAEIWKGKDESVSKMINS